MIPVTRLNGSKLTINALLIETIEETPDTLITLTTGKKFIVTEKVSDVVSLVKAYMQNVGSIRVAVKNNVPEGS
ncbi:flagellar FlbD family protein [Paenibacillus flagellatus]|jgi:flagellar protein FlbD|uniref:Flagellar protein D n=1 Tax=Paenibacillus flagellatus TaxID=2211139 RepID=A0A2V5JUM4_9BACL|nr:flagellar FlbD family protein [Paenibacillus flagellatus]MDF2722984.1 flagellar FlbD family protein [Paenibacillus sp.]PYI50375.1 flagellar protein D [Paenibacillus flagellatus]